MNDMVHYELQFAHGPIFVSKEIDWETLERYDFPENDSVKELNRIKNRLISKRKRATAMCSDLVYRVIHVKEERKIEIVRTETVIDI